MLDRPHPPLMSARLFVEQVGDDQRRRQHAMLQFGNVGKFVRAEVSLHVDKMCGLAPSGEDQ